MVPAGVAYNPPPVVDNIVITGRTALPEQDLHGEGTGGLVFVNKRTGEVILDTPLDSTLHGGVAVQARNLFSGTVYSQAGGVEGK